MPEGKQRPGMLAKYSRKRYLLLRNSMKALGPQPRGKPHADARRCLSSNRRQCVVKVIIVAALVLATSAMTSSATTTNKSEIERWKLYTACAPMDFLVESLRPKNVREIGLTRETIVNAMESRLRAARLFALTPIEKKNQYLYVNVNIVGSAFHIAVELYRYLVYWN